ncbi:MAG: hypothetical protein GX951_03195, partial [Mollicutes bacterium]|nr:hypothetical protein [Mollicutes bacterium]
MQNQYIIPANSKKSALFLGFFTGRDVIVVLVGVSVTILLLLLIKMDTLLGLTLEILPAVISAALVFPIPNYHNVMQLMLNIIEYFTERRKYY